MLQRLHGERSEGRLSGPRLLQRDEHLRAGPLSELLVLPEEALVLRVGRDAGVLPSDLDHGLQPGALRLSRLFGRDLAER